MRGGESFERSSTAAFRVFRPPLQAHVELRSSIPARVFFRGLRGFVMSASGPWRTSGDWWREDAWRHDEWDLDIRFDPTHTASPDKAGSAVLQAGLYCFYFDAVSRSWSVRGVYD